MHRSSFNIVSILFLGILCFSCQSLKRQGKTVNASVEEGSVSSVSPAWVRQSNVYEVNVRQYTTEGTFRAFRQALPRLRQMGVDILWFMPITPISKTDRKGTLGSYYAVQHYTAINPEFGTMQEWKSLVNEAHKLGFKVITDWVANHTGADHPWLKTHPQFYNLDTTGKAKFAFDWSDTRDLNYDNRELRDSMITAMKYWITESDIDGFRCDVAAEVPDDFWKECITTLRKTKSLFMLAEGEKGELHRDGFDATYSWDLFQTMKKIASGDANALLLDTVLMRQAATFPAGAIRLCFTSNHDENSWNKSDYGTFPGERHAPFAVLTQTFANALPLIYSGQEEPVLRKIEFFEKDKMEFGSYRRAAFYNSLLNLRKSTPALSVDAEFKKIPTGKDNFVYAYMREKSGRKVFVILNLNEKTSEITFPQAPITGEAENLFSGTKEKLHAATRFSLPAWGYLVYYN
jgi:alpha-amylase